MGHRTCQQQGELPALLVHLYDLISRKGFTTITIKISGNIIVTSRQSEVIAPLSSCSLYTLSSFMQNIAAILWYFVTFNSMELSQMMDIFSCPKHKNSDETCEVALPWTVLIN